MSLGHSQENLHPNLSPTIQSPVGFPAHSRGLTVRILRRIKKMLLLAFLLLTPNKIAVFKDP